MRTTIRLNEDLLAAAKDLALRSGRTLTSVIEDALRESLARQRKQPPARRVKLPCDGKGGVMPGVDLTNSAELLDIMEEHRGAAGR